MPPDLVIKGTVLLWGLVTFSVWVHVRDIKMQTVITDFVSAGDGWVPLRPPAAVGGGGGIRGGGDL